MSSSYARHRKPQRFSGSPTSGSARHRKRSLFNSLMRRPAQVAGITAAILVVGGTAASAVIFRPTPASHAPSAQADSVGREAAAVPTAAVAPQQEQQPLAATAARSHRKAHPQAEHLAAPIIKTGPAVAQVAKKPAKPKPKPRPSAIYLNPLRSVSNLLLERVDMGCDFGGSGPLYAIGDAVITNATSSSGGWPGGGWITYRLTDGPAAGMQVYVAEDVTPTVQVGQDVTPRTVIANMFNGGSGIETGWAMPDGSSAESQLPVAGGVSGGGPFPTMIGLNFDQLLQAVGVAPAPNYSQSGFGVLPAQYSGNWAAALR